MIESLFFLLFFFEDLPPIEQATYNTEVLYVQTYTF